jgi:hypothetical protein
VLPLLLRHRRVMATRGDTGLAPLQAAD